ncbi:MAG TPA: hypothetical protein VFC21_12875 [Bryobacteraceae bacterium]|nr:hypothetical protein [Bryobacteraceae bacterium]
MDLNLETLKGEILDYLAVSEFAVFRSHPGGLEAMPLISWDTERFPDYRMFLDTARKVGEKLILFAARELDEEEVEEAVEELEDADVPREDKREFEKRIREAHRNIGAVCAIEIAFDHNSHLYVYEARPDWYEEFLEACDELTAMLPGVDDVEDDGHDSIGGFYSNN